MVELRFGALLATWGKSRMDQLQRLLDRAVIIPVDEEVMWTHARLRLACRRVGHPLNEEFHASDLWIAASAAAHKLPLVSDDSIFVGVPGLNVIHEGP